ncbi:hypothetical protein PQX77_009076, partial [Marasmius sp. AFHP31]
ITQACSTCTQSLDCSSCGAFTVKVGKVKSILTSGCVLAVSAGTFFWGTVPVSPSEESPSPPPRNSRKSDQLRNLDIRARWVVDDSEIAAQGALGQGASRWPSDSGQVMKMNQ